MSKNVKSLLLLNSTEVNYNFALLFHCARHWAQQGRRVFFVCKAPINSLPLMIGKIDQFFHPDIIKLIQFMYLTTWQDLLEQLYTIHLRHYPVSVIIVENLEYYLKNESDTGSHASLICASLLYAASVCANLTSKPTILITDYICEDLTIEKNIVKSFFHNIWEVKVSQENGSKKIKLSQVPFWRPSETSIYYFKENLEDSTFSVTEIVKKIISLEED